MAKFKLKHHAFAFSCLFILFLIVVYIIDSIFAGRFVGEAAPLDIIDISEIIGYSLLFTIICYPFAYCLIIES